MMISPEGYRNKLEKLTPEELYEEKKKLEKFINDYENHNLPEEAYRVKPSPETKYKYVSQYLNELMTEVGVRRHQSEWQGVTAFFSQCADCTNYLGDINCKIHGEIDFEVLDNEKQCNERNNMIKEIENTIEEILQSEDINLKETILTIVDFISKSKAGSELSIAKILHYNPKENYVEPLTQGKIYNYVIEVCKKCNIYIEETDDSIGGLAFYLTFKRSDIKSNKELLIEVTEVNCGLIGPFDAVSRKWSIFSNLTVKLEIEQEGIDKITYNYILREEQFGIILDNINLAKAGEYVASGNDGMKYEFIQYENDNIMWKKELGYIHGILPLEKIIETLDNLNFIHNSLPPKEDIFELSNDKIKDLTKRLAEAYRKNDQTLINSLQNEIQEESDKHLRENMDKIAQEDAQQRHEFRKKEKEFEEIRKIDFNKTNDKSNIVIREYYVDENGHERDEIKTLDESSNKETNKVLTLDDFNKFVDKLMDNKQKIELRDNKKNIVYTIDKYDNKFNLKIEKTINFNDKTNDLFEDLKKYIDSIDTSSGYWPSQNTEYPDLMELWRTTTNYNNEQNHKRGALKYPENWELVASKIENEIINSIKENNK